MKPKLTRCFKTLFLLPLIWCAIPASAWDGGPYYNNCNQYDACNSCGCGVYFIYENVIVKPYCSRNYAYYLVDPNNIEGQTAKMFDWDYEYSPRFELGWINDCGLGIRGRYWRFHNDNRLTASSADGEIAVFYAEDLINPEIGFEDAERAKFRHCLDLDVVDVEFVFQYCYWTYSAGGRGAWLDQHYRAQELEPDSDSFIAKHKFDGGGLTTAIEYLRPVWCNFSLFTKARGSLLYGDSNFLTTEPTGESAIRSSNDTDIMAVGELQLGVDWRTSICNVCTFLRFAIETQYWLGAGSAGGPGNNALFDEGNYQNSNAEDANLGFFGFNVAIGFLF